MAAGQLSQPIYLSPTSTKIELNSINFIISVIQFYFQTSFYANQLVPSWPTGQRCILLASGAVTVLLGCEISAEASAQLGHLLVPAATARWRASRPAAAQSPCNRRRINTWPTGASFFPFSKPLLTAVAKFGFVCQSINWPICQLFRGKTTPAVSPQLLTDY